MKRTRQSGFTLLELLVALVVLGILMTSLSQATRFSLASWARMTWSGQQHDPVMAADRLLRRLIAETMPGTDPMQSVMLGTRATLVFTSRLPMAAGAVTIARMRLSLLDNRAFALDSWPPAAGRDGSKIPLPNRTIILPDVEAVAFRYWSDNRRAWQSEWQEAGLPDLIEIDLQLPGGGARTWPPILVSLRSRPPE